jgi:hypothetical protein
MKRTTCTTLAAAAALLLWTACGLIDAEPDPEIGESTVEILGGTSDTQFPSVCGMRVALPLDEDGNPQDPIVCTCTLVEECTVLTSARCVSENLEAGALDDIDVRFGQGLEGGTPYEVEHVEIYRYFNPDGPNTNELALLRLVEPCPAVTPAVLNEELGPSDSGQTLTIVGFGETIRGNEGTQGTRTRTDVTISTVAARYILAGTTESTSCAGDSGGPGFIDRGQGPVLASINARQGGCNVSVQRLRVDRYVHDFLYPFIDRFSGPCKEDGECVTTGCRTPDPDCPENSCLWGNTCDEDCPTRDWDCDIGVFAGAACESSGQCEEGGRCIAAGDDETFTYCSRRCDLAVMSDCPQGMECTDLGGGQGECTWTLPSPGSQGFSCVTNTQCRSGICEGGICVFECGAGGSCPDPYSCGESQVSPGTLVCLGESLQGGGGFCAVSGGPRGWLGLLLVLGAAPFLLGRRRRRR